MAGIAKVLNDIIFDTSRENLDRVPDVPQTPMERYNPPRGMPSNLEPILTQEAADRLTQYALRGEELGGRGWYNLDPLRQEFVTRLGPDEGTAQFNRYTDFLAATSPRSRVAENIRRASYFRNLEQQGQPFAGLKNADLAKGYGHLAHETQNALIADLADGGSFVGLNRPKVSSFAENLRGNQAPMTIDTHNFAAVRGDFGMKKSPSKTQYRYLEEFQADIARTLDMTPAQFQASVWMGADTGVADARPFMQVFDGVLARTAQRDKKTKREALNDFIDGKTPLYSMAGGPELVAGSLLDTRQPGVLEEQARVDEHRRRLGVLMEPLEEDPGYNYGYLLPIKRSQDPNVRENDTFGGFRPAVPGLARDAIRALADLGLSAETGVYNPQAALDILF
jgi:hypothetical protein